MDEALKESKMERTFLERQSRFASLFMRLSRDYDIMMIRKDKSLFGEVSSTIKGTLAEVVTNHHQVTSLLGQTNRIDGVTYVGESYARQVLADRLRKNEKFAAYFANHPLKSDLAGNVAFEINESYKYYLSRPKRRQNISEWRICRRLPWPYF